MSAERELNLAVIERLQSDPQLCSRYLNTYCVPRNKKLERKFQTLITALYKRTNLLNENLPKFGWQMWNNYDGTISSTSHSVRMTKIHVKASKKVEAEITDMIKQMAARRDVNIYVADTKCYMSNPDRCVYEATIYLMK